MKLLLFHYATLVCFLGSFAPNANGQQTQNHSILKQSPTPGHSLATRPGPNQAMGASNNECTGATPLTFNVPVADNNIGATQSRPAILCNFATSATANDVWFTFTYTAEMDSLVVVPQSNNSYNIVIELFAGGCGSLTSIACADFAEPNSNNQTEGFLLNSIGVIVGQTYKLRMYGFNGVECNFVALLKAGTPPAPANDNCTSAKTLVAGVTTGETSVGATQTMAPIVCSGQSSTEAKDVWFKFTKTAAMDTLAIYPGSDLDLVLDVRSNNCTTGTSVGCSDKPGDGVAEKVSLSALTNGTIYLARVYGKNGTAGEFSIRIKTAPVNNNCSGAIALTPGLNCSGAIVGTTVDASQSLGAVTCSATTGNADDDVWYTFTMQAGMDTVKVTPGTFFNAVVDLRSGTCANNSNIRCADNPTQPTAIEKIYVGDLTPGNAYFIRVYGFGAGEGTQGSFQICLTQSAPPPPSNDECTAPVQLVAAETVNSNNINATQTLPGVPCGGNTSPIANDVWYRFTKTDATDTIVVDGLGVINLYFDVRTNSCPNGTLVKCSEAQGNGEKKISIANLTNGIYLMRVYGYNGATGAFSLLIKDSEATTAPENDDCFAAADLLVPATCNAITGTNVAATESQPAGACSGSGAAKDVWYTFTATSTKAIVKLFCGVGFDGALEVFSGSCFGLTSVACSDLYGPTTPDEAAIEQVILQNLMAGQQYFVRVYGHQGDEGTFTICAFNPTCTTPAPTLTTSRTSIVSNQAFTASVTGVTGLTTFETSPNQTTWTTALSSLSAIDTLVGKSATNATLYVRANGSNGNCYPANSNIVAVAIKCATPITNPASTGDYITSFKLGSIENASTRNPLGGNYQDFTSISGAVCRGNSYPLGISANQAGVSYNRLVWIDFNQDGDFGDTGENVLFGPYSANASVSGSVTIPANATPGATRVRVALLNNNATLSSFNPCATGPYLYGEIEEYTLNITDGATANAGPAQNICSGSATLAANNPGAGSTGLWTVVSGTGLFANATQYNTTVSGLSAGANVFKWTITSPCGNSDANVTITSALVVSNAGPDQALCSANATLAANSSGSGTGVWTVFSGAGTFTNPSQNNTGVTNLGIGVNRFIWSVTSGGCPVAKDTVSITRSAEPSNAAAGSDQTVCASVATLSATAPAIGTGTWSTTGSATITTPANASTTVTGLVAGANTFRWTVSNGTCTPKTDDVVINVETPPVANAGLDQETCSPTATLAGTAVANGAYLWTVLSGTATVVSAGTISTPVVGLGPGVNQFVFQVSRAGCPPDKDTVTVTRKTAPVATVGPALSVCSTEVFLTGTNPTSGSGLWTLVSGAGLIAFPTQGNSGVSNLGYGANVFRWTVSDAPCPNATADLTVTNNLPPKPNAGPDQTVCDRIATLNATTVGSLSTSWATVAGGGTVVNPTGTSSLVTGLTVGANLFRFTVDVPACSTSVADTVAVTRQANPVNLDKDTAVCQNFTPTYTIVGPPGMASYSWNTTATTPQITVSTAGQYILSVVTPQNCTFTDTVNVTFVICVGVAKPVYNQKNLSIIPNPSAREAALVCSLPDPEWIELSIADMKGVLVAERQQVFVSENDRIALPGHLQSGTYVVHVRGKNLSQSLKWVVVQ